MSLGPHAAAPRPSPGLALFDFDGTLTTADSFFHFLLKEHGVVELARFVPWALPKLLGWGLGVVDAKRAKEALAAGLYRGRSVESVEAMGEHFAHAHLPALLRPRAMERVAWHAARGHRVAVVTASFRYWIEPWARAQGLDLVATRLQERDGVLTGRFDGPNCNGHEKVRRVRERYDLRAYERIWAYGNTAGDRPMMATAHEAQFRPFE